MVDEILGLCSMATRRVLADLADQITREHGLAVRFASAGGVEVARQVRQGEPADLVVLSADALAALCDEGLVAPASLRPLFVSEVVAAVPAGRPARDLLVEADLRDSLTSASRIAYSTGPSGTALLALLERWHLSEVLAGRLVQAQPGVPVASLLAEGRADLGIQQRSEFLGVAGVRVLGPLPEGAAIRSTFSAAIPIASHKPEDAASVLQLLGSDMARNAAARHGLALPQSPS